MRIGIDFRVAVSQPTGVERYILNLTRALLQGASKEFPRRTLVATAFDPYGERIGGARLESGGEVRWEK